MTPKQARVLSLVEAEPGITQAEIHRRIGRDYAHGHHRFTYATCARLLRAKRLARVSPAPGLRGIGLRVVK